MQLGRLEEVNIRELWKHEQHDFSQWLMKEENIELLNEMLGLSLIDVEEEVYVGSYRCDLVGKDETTGIKVIIENQLEATNHDHLGKIITYASGLEADVIVWIVKEAREEHRSAIEWLNNNTIKNISFFLIEIHAYKIGDSIPAPKFEIIEQPNDFIKNIKGINGNEELNKSRVERLYFWNKFNEEIIDQGKPFNIRKATTDHWYSVAIGTSGVHIIITLVNKNNNIGVGILIDDNKELFDNLFNNKDKIHEELQFNMDWQRLNEKKSSRITYYIDGLDFDNHSNYEELMKKIIEKVVKIRDVFKKYI